MPKAGHAVSKIYCSVELPKLGMRVILNQEIESGVYAKKIKSINRSSNKTYVRFMLHVRHKKEHCTYTVFHKIGTPFYFCSNFFKR